jgi:hypothetical protein
MFRRYNRWWSRFDQPDPYAGSYDLGDPQSFNRYASTSNDPVNFVDPTGLEPIICGPEYSGPACLSAPGFWGGGSNVNDRRSSLNPSGRDIIANAEPRVAVFVFDFAENLLAVQVQPSMFNRQSSTFWWGFFSKDQFRNRIQRRHRGRISRVTSVGVLMAGDFQRLLTILLRGRV